MKSENYVIIQGWMCNELQLKGNDLLVFALIYGFSQDGVSMFSGGRQYIADTFNISKPTVDKALQNLISMNYIIKYPSADFVHTDSYATNIGVVKKLYDGSKETLPGGSKETLLNNISNNKKVNNNTLSKDKVENFLKHDDIVKPKKLSLWDKCVSEINDFTDDEILREWLTEFLKMCLDNSKESGTPFYTNTFKGKLNKLKQLSTDNYIQRKIVMQTLDNGWAGFYALKEEKQYKKRDVFGEQGKVKSNGYTDEDEAEDERINKEREQKGLRTRF